MARVYTWPGHGLPETPFSGADPTVVQTVADKKNPSTVKLGGGVFFHSPGICNRVPDAIWMVVGQSLLGQTLLTLCQREPVKRMAIGTPGSCLMHFIKKDSSSVYFIRTKEWVLLHTTAFAVEQKDKLVDRPQNGMVLAPDALLPLILHTHFSATSSEPRWTWRRTCGLWWMDRQFNSFSHLSSEFQPQSSTGRRVELDALTLFFFADASFFQHHNHPAVVPGLYRRFIEGVYTNPSRRAWENETLYSSVAIHRMAGCVAEIDEKSAAAREIVRAWRLSKWADAMRLSKNLSEHPRFLELGATVSLYQCCMLAATWRDTSDERRHPRRILGRTVSLESVMSQLIKRSPGEATRLSGFIEKRTDLVALEFTDTRVTADSLRHSLSTSLTQLSHLKTPTYTVVSYVAGERHHVTHCCVLALTVLRACNLVSECLHRTHAEFVSGVVLHSLPHVIRDAFFHSDTLLNKAARLCMQRCATVKWTPRPSVDGCYGQVHPFRGSLSMETYQKAWTGIGRKLGLSDALTVSSDGKGLVLPLCRSMSVDSRTSWNEALVVCTDINSLCFRVGEEFVHSLTLDGVVRLDGRSPLRQPAMRSYRSFWEMDEFEMSAGGPLAMTTTIPLPPARPVAHLTAKNVAQQQATEKTHSADEFNTGTPSPFVIVAEAEYVPSSPAVTPATATAATAAPANGLVNAGVFQHFDPLSMFDE